MCPILALTNKYLQAHQRTISHLFQQNSGIFLIFFRKMEAILPISCN